VTEVFGKVQNFHPGVQFSQIIQNGATLIRGAIINKDDLIAAAELLE